MSAGPQVQRLDAPDGAHADGLAALLVDAVDGGASMGFHAPLQPHAALAYWRNVAASLDAGTALWVAHDDGGRIVGSVQMQRATQENGRHRAEVRSQGWQRAGEIPDFASSADGALHATALYFKRVGPDSSQRS